MEHYCFFFCFFFFVFLFLAQNKSCRTKQNSNYRDIALSQYVILPAIRASKMGQIGLVVTHSVLQYVSYLVNCELPDS